MTSSVPNAAVDVSLAELAFDMCPSETNHGLLHHLAIHLDPAAHGSPSFHLSFECCVLVRDSEQSLSSDRAADDLTALVLVVFATIILAGLDEDPDAVLAARRTITSSSTYLFLAALDADSTFIAVLDRNFHQHMRAFTLVGQPSLRMQWTPATL